MPADAEGEEMVIEDRNPVIDTESANRGSVLTREFLDRIPAGRSYQSAVQLTAGVSGGANPNVGGASSNENTYMLDGVNITDPVTGTFPLNFNFDSIEQLEVITDAFDPEYGVNLGGVINIVTQTGSNNFEFRSGIYHKNGSGRPSRTGGSQQTAPPSRRATSVASSKRGLSAARSRVRSSRTRRGSSRRTR